MDWRSSEVSSEGVAVKPIDIDIDRCKHRDRYIDII